MNELEAARRASVRVASLHTGGCGACAQSVAALSASRYAGRLRAQGVTLTATLRQADVVLLCGALNEQARDAVIRLVEATPRPRALVAVGDCALNGCVFAGSPALTMPLAETLGVNVEISGCPPAPDAIIDAIAEAQRLLAAEATEEDEDGGEAATEESEPAEAAPPVKPKKGGSR